ncbi:MAG: hypothetical protein ACREV0_09460 [Burkholderiales bacterium]
MNIPLQLKNNLVALISLCVAIFSVFYAGWRDNSIEERGEHSCRGV